MITVYGKNGNYIGWIDTKRDGILMQSFDGEHIKFKQNEIFHEENPDPNFTVEVDYEQDLFAEETELYANEDGLDERYDPSEDY